MLHALLHGKLDGELKRGAYEIEDLLTSVVIGTCSYLEPSVALLPFLARARDVDNRPIDFGDVASVEYEFWPAMRANEREQEVADGGEPEVLITLTRSDGSKALLVIEAKLFSGKSSRPSETGPVSDQLGKYWLHLCNRASDDATTLGVVYVTRGVTLPRNEFAETQGELREKRQPAAKLYWLSWRDFVPAVQAHSNRHRLLRDVVELLDEHWNLVLVRMGPWPSAPKPPAFSFTPSWRWGQPNRRELWIFEPKGVGK